MNSFNTACDVGKCWTVSDDAVVSLGAVVPFFHPSLKNPPPFCGRKIPQLPTDTAACRPLLDLLSSHFHLPEIQQGTKYLWCFNPTCQCAGAVAFICFALFCYTLHIWRPSITKSLWLHSGSQPPCMLKLLQETELLDLFIQLPRLRRDTQCLQPWPGSHTMIAVISMHK